MYFEWEELRRSSKYSATGSKETSNASKESGTKDPVTNSGCGAGVEQK